MLPRLSLLLLLLAAPGFAQGAPQSQEEETWPDSLSLRLDSVLAENDDPWGGLTPPTGPIDALPVKPGEELIGAGAGTHTVLGTESLLQVARAFSLGFNEVELANPGIDVWIPPVDSAVSLPFRWVLPAPALKPNRVAINLPEMRIYYRADAARVFTFPIGIGREGWETPTGLARVTWKRADPPWRPPASIREEDPELPAVVPPGPENPLGTHAVYLSLPGYLIHGTNKPFGIGRRVSHGCIRLYPEHIPAFFDQMEKGVRVEIVNQPVKAGWQGEEIWLEAHPPLASDKEEGDQPTLMEHAAEVIRAALSRRPRARVLVDWQAVERAVTTIDGRPHKIAAPWGDFRRNLTRKAAIVEGASAGGRAAVR